MKHPGKFRTHFLGPYEVAYVTEGGVAQLKTLNGEWKEGLVSGSRLKLYMTTSCLTNLSERMRTTV
jgi:hypothetical protein